MKISVGSIAFIFENCRRFTITDFAWRSGNRHEHKPSMWDSLVDNFSKHAVEVEKILKAASKQ